MNQPETECCIVASLFADTRLMSMDYPGPNVCSVIAHWEHFESVEARIVAQAVCKCIDKGWRITRNNVRRLMTDEYKGWIDHPMFGEDQSLPLSGAESEALWLLTIYKRKRIAQVIGEAFAACTMKPENTRQVAIDLKYRLEELV